MKPRITINGVTTEFETQAEFDAFVLALDGPPPDLTNYIKAEQHEMIGKNVVRELFVTLREQNLTEAQEGDLISRVYPVLGCLSDGFIRGAKVVCNSIATGGQFTQARKTYLLDKIDEAITKL